MECLDKAIESLTKLRIQAIKEKRSDLEQKLHEIEMLIFQSYDNKNNVSTLPTLTSFRELRLARKFTLRQVEEMTGISNAYLSQLETGKIKKPSYEVVQKLNNLYASSGV